MRTFLDRLTFGAAALSLGLLLAFVLKRGDFDGMNAGAGTILFSFLLAAFVAAPYLAQHAVNRRVRSRAGGWGPLVGLVAAVGLGIAAYGTVVFGNSPDSLDAVVFMAVPLWQALLIGLGFGVLHLTRWWRRRGGAA